MLLVVGFLGVRWYDHGGRWFVSDTIRDGLDAVLVRVLSGFPSIAVAATHTLNTLLEGFLATWVLSLFLGCLAVPLGATVRMLARGAARAGRGNGLARARRWMQEHRLAAGAILAIPAVLTQLPIVLEMSRDPWHRGHDIVLMTVLLGLAQWRLARGGWNALSSPLDVQGGDGGVEIDDREIRFRAVAVTRETKGAVAALAVLTVTVLAFLATATQRALFSDLNTLRVAGGYVVVAALSAWLFQHASRIAVGRDGVFVGGTSRRRFFAYRELDEVRETHGDLELRRGGKTILRLQLHGQDATRRAAILARIEEGIARADHVARDGAASFVAAASTHTVARSAVGGADYRMRAVSTDALWSLVEGSGVDAAARTAAAKAVVAGGGERDRVRVAASLCADPAVRDALEDVAEDAQDAEESAIAPGSAAARRLHS